MQVGRCGAPLFRVFCSFLGIYATSFPRFIAGIERENRGKAQLLGVISRWGRIRRRRNWSVGVYTLLLPTLANAKFAELEDVYRNLRYNFLPRHHTITLGTQKKKETEISIWRPLFIIPSLMRIATSMSTRYASILSRAQEGPRRTTAIDCNDVLHEFIVSSFTFKLYLEIVA